MSIKIGPESVRQVFAERFAGAPRMYRAPGRINLIGEHTDYNDGLVFPSTVDLFSWAAVGDRKDRLLRIHLCHEDKTYDIYLDDLAKGARGKAVEYLKGVVWALSEAAYPLAGRDIVIDGNIPIGGGLSSSASLELLLAFALTGGDHDQEGRIRLAQACQRAEGEYVGVQCGIMDQFAIALGQKGQAMKLDCRSLDFDFHPLPSDASLLVVHSGVAHQLPAGEYNSRRDECNQAVSELRSQFPELESLRDLELSQLQQSASSLGDLLYRRCRHVVTENLRVNEAERAMDANDMATLGELIHQSHVSLRDDYEVSCKELDELVDLTMACDGVLGSRMMGGGFGGCTISLVRNAQAELVAAQVAAEYGAMRGSEPWMHVVGPAGPVGRLEE